MTLPQRPTVLCVDDEPDLLRDLSEELEEAGYQVLAADSGRAALAQIRRTRPDLILCDISMPRMDGFELLQAVRDMGAELAGIPFVFLTALSDPRDIVAGKRVGADDYLVKPIDYDLLLVTVQARLRQVRRIRAAGPAGTPDVDAQGLVERFGLTPTEARVAAGLARGGKSLEQVATDLGIARSTAAFHLRNIFAKTGTNRQVDLVALVFRSILPGD